MEWSMIIFSQLSRVPFLIIYSIGIILAITRWKRHPHLSLLTLCAFAALLVNLLVGAAVAIWQVTAFDRGISTMDVAKVYGVMGLIHIVLGVIAWTLILLALFTARPRVRYMLEE